MYFFSTLVINCIPIVFASSGIKVSINRFGVVYVTGEAKPELKSSVCTGQYQMVLISPELLVENRYWRKMLTSAVYTTRLKAFVIDEAHCVAKW